MDTHFDDGSLELMKSSPSLNFMILSLTVQNAFYLPKFESLFL